MLRPCFLGSFPRADVPLDPPLPEIAFIGRSNVGKSSLLNALAGSRIAKISGTPGKTRALNVFLIPGLGPGAWALGGDAASPRPQAPSPMYFLDLPGYGYARAGKAQRAAFKGLVKHALRRERLSGVVWLIDIRHPPSADDRTMQELLVEMETRVLAALTKGDKLTTLRRRARAVELRDELGLPDDQVIVTSVKTSEGIMELQEAIGGLVAEASA